MQPLLFSKLKTEWVSVKSKALAALAARDEREQRVIKIGGGVVAALLFYVCVVSPVFQHLDDLRASIAHDRKTLAWMRGMDAALASSEKSTVPASGKMSLIDCLSALQTTINKTSLSQGLSGLKQSGSDRIEVHFKNISFDALIAWLTTTMAPLPLTLSNFSATSTGDTPGTVNADLVLTIATQEK